MLETIEGFEEGHAKTIDRPNETETDGAVGNACVIPGLEYLRVNRERTPMSVSANELLLVVQFGVLHGGKEVFTANPEYLLEVNLLAVGTAAGLMVKRRSRDREVAPF